MRRWVSLLVWFALPAHAQAQAPAFLVEDLNPNARPGFSSPASFTAAGSLVYFVAEEPTTGRELYETDGTTGGTARVRDLLPGAGSAFDGFAPFDLAALGTRLYFAANDGASGEELWSSDGTEAGTVLVRDVRPGRNASGPTSLVAAGSLLFFSADDGSAGRELWRTDGTGAGTTRVRDVRAGSAGSSPADLVAQGSRIFFSADDGVSGRELWVSDGTASGTSRVRDIRPGAASSFPQLLTKLGTRVFFSADDGVSGRELWVSDGTASGTSRVRDIRIGPAPSLPRDLVRSGGVLLFSAFDGSDWTLWLSDGSEQGTRAVGGPASLPGAGPPRGLVNVDGVAYFSAEGPGAGRELYRSDGTPRGTALVRDLRAGPLASYPHELTRLAAGVLAFVAEDGVSGPGVWRCDGSGAGTTPVASILPAYGSTQRAGLTAVAGTLYLNATSGASGYEPWASDGTTAGTRLLRNIRPDAASSGPSSLIAVGDRVLFSAHDGILAEDDGARGREPWASDGTAAGTLRLRDVRAGPESSDPVLLGRVNGRVLFSAFDETNGRELWASDGTAAGTALVRNLRAGSLSAIDAAFTNPAGNGYFAAEDGLVGRELWRSDGTSAGTVRVKDIRPGAPSSDPLPFGELDGLLFLSANDLNGVRVLWTSDGTDAGTVFLKDIRPPDPFPPALSAITEAVVVNDVLFFRAVVGGEELWRSDGTAAGTLRVAFNPAELASVNGGLLFRGDGSEGMELWTSDGTLPGTTRLVDIHPSGDSIPNELTPVRGRVFFRADDGTRGAELWITDGTAAGTRLLRDIRPGPGGSFPSQLRELNGRLYFAANDGTTGEELWTSDGTAAGTRRLADVVPGTGGSAPAALESAGGLLFFTADDGAHARELWALPLPCGNGVLDPGEECDDGGNVDGDGCAATCESDDALPLFGTAQGGSVSLDVDGIAFAVTTHGGQTAAQVAAALAAAINTNSTLFTAGTWALALGGQLVTSGVVANAQLTDPGLAFEPQSPTVPALGTHGAVALALLLALSALRARRVGRHARALLIALCAAGPGAATPGAALAQTYPILSPEYEVTDASLAQTTYGYNNETSNMVQIGRSLYFVYHAAASGGFDDGNVYVRRFDLDGATFDPPVRVSDFTSPPDYHDQPTLVRDALENLLVLYPFVAQRQLGATTDRTFRPRQRALHDLARPDEWSAPTGLPGRVPNDFFARFCVDPRDPLYAACGAHAYDCMGVFDERSGVSHIACEGGPFNGLDGHTDAGGLSRMYWRIQPDGRADGPYMLVEAATNVRPPNSLAGGNIFAKGDLALGKEALGPRSLHLAWELRNTYSQLQDPNRPRDEDPASPGYNPLRGVTHVYDLYYARSDDGGDSWRNVTGTVSHALTEGLYWNDPNFRVVQAEMEENAARAWALDSQNRPFFLYGRHRPGTGRMVWGHVDAGWPGARYDMVWTRWTGSGWTGGTIQESTFTNRARVRIDLEDKIWIFHGAPPRYAVSANGGQSWSPFTAYGVPNGWRPHAYADRLDPNYQYVVYQDGVSGRVYFVRMQLTNVPLAGP